MEAKIAETIAQTHTGDWKTINVEFGDDFFDVRVPPLAHS